MVHQNVQIGLENVLPTLNGSDASNVPNGSATDERKGNVTYGIDDAPPWYLCIFLALQHYLTMIGAIVAIPFILCPALCMEETDPDRSNIISTMIFVTGLITWLQCTFGCRLPIVQGGTISFLVPTLAILNLPAWKCPAPDVLAVMSGEERRTVWTSRMCELSGAIAVSALFQVIGGYFGIIGSLLRFVTPLTIAPTVALVGLTLFDHAADAASQQWGIAAGYVAAFVPRSHGATVGDRCDDDSGGDMKDCGDEFGDASHSRGRRSQRIPLASNFSLLLTSFVPLLFKSPNATSSVRMDSTTSSFGSSTLRRAACWSLNCVDNVATCLFVVRCKNLIGKSLPGPQDGPSAF